jgi:hypothetical protein
MPLKQPAYGSLQLMLNEAIASKPWFEKQVGKFAAATQGNLGKIGLKNDKDNPGKPSARALQKAKEKAQENHDKDNGYRYVKDILRGTVSYANCGEIFAAVGVLARHFTVVELKDHVTNPKAGGYADINLIVVDPDSLLMCELQIHFQGLLDAKSVGHESYAVERNATNGVALRDMPQGKNFGIAQRAIWKGQDAYCKSRIEISHDPNYAKMIGGLRVVEQAANVNAKTYMAKVEVYKPQAQPVSA